VVAGERTVPAEATAAAVVAVAKALIEAANDFGEGNQIGGDVWKLAGAALDAALPHAASAERDRIRQLAAGQFAWCAGKPGVPGRWFADLLEDPQGGTT